MTTRRWSVVSGLIEDGDRLLLVANRRRSGAVDWSPPGGVVDPGEAHLDALTREVAEETGLTVEQWQGPVYEVTVDFGAAGGHLRVLVYRATGWSGALVIDDPDGIVHEASWHALEACHDRLCTAPDWVAVPLRAWLDARDADLRTYAWRVVGGTDLASLVVERIEPGEADAP